MTLKELQAVYPGATVAIEWQEQPYNECIWQELRELGTSPQRTIDLIKLGCATSIIALIPGINECPPEIIARAARVLEQLDHPDFAHYVAAKLGALRSRSFT